MITAVWFIIGIIGLHIMNCIYPDQMEPWEVWTVILGPFLLLGALYMAIKEAVNCKHD